MSAILLICFFSAFFSLALLLFLGLVAYAVLSRQSQEEAWRELARRSGLFFEPGGFPRRPSLHGSYRGRQARLDIHSHSAGYGPGTGSFPYTRVRLTLEGGAGVKLTIREKRRMPPFARATTPSGDPAVDLQYSIQSEPPDLATRLFKSASLRQRIMAARSFDLEISPSLLQFEGRGVEKDVEYLLGLLELLSDIADFVEGAGHSHP